MNDGQIEEQCLCCSKEEAEYKAQQAKQQPQKNDPTRYWVWPHEQQYLSMKDTICVGTMQRDKKTGQVTVKQQNFTTSSEVEQWKYKQIVARSPKIDNLVQSGQIERQCVRMSYDDAENEAERVIARQPQNSQECAGYWVWPSSEGNGRISTGLIIYDKKQQTLQFCAVKSQEGEEIGIRGILQLHPEIQPLVKKKVINQDQVVGNAQIAQAQAKTIIDQINQGADRGNNIQLGKVWVWPDPGHPGEVVLGMIIYDGKNALFSIKSTDSLSDSKNGADEKTSSIERKISKYLSEAKEKKYIGARPLTNVWDVMDSDPYPDSDSDS